MNIAFIGLGVMGFPMAGHLKQAGHAVRVFNRSPEKTARWIERFEGQGAASPAAAAAGAELVALCVGDDSDVSEVVKGEHGVLSTLEPGALLVDHTTASAALARELHDSCAQQQVAFLDAPVSGGQAGAETGTLTIMVGGDEAAFSRVRPVLEHYAKCVRLLGPAGAGQLAKMVNQICIAGLVQGLSEALLFSERAGLDSRAVIDVIRQGAAQSWQMENRYESMLENHYEHGFAVNWMRKDLGMVFAEAQRLGLSLPVTELVDGFYAQIQAMGGGRWDTSSLLARLQAQTTSGESQRVEEQEP
jgi:3-hydroxyisobutyrate dehydrogenase-like beta-hydroxyacid dehydrogenase